MGHIGQLNWLRKRRRVLEDSLAARGRAHTLSLARYRLHRAITKAISEHARGVCLDAGSGRSPYKRMLQQYAEHVTSVDVEDRSGETDIIADIQSMPQLPDASFDTILCSQVLEHVPRPWNAMREFARVLRPKGVLILTVPHLSIIHEAPHDYYRYTRYGLKALCEQAVLEVLKLEPTGGLWCFLAHSCSLALTCTAGSVPPLRWPVWLVNYALLVRSLGIVDRFFGAPGIYPCDYLVVAHKSKTGA